MTDQWRDLPAAALLGASFLAVLAVAELWVRRGHPKPEWPRKLAHTGGGVVCLFFPFLIRSSWTVLAMSLPLSVFFTWGKRAGFLKSLHTVRRRSRGSEYYPLAIYLVFLLVHDRPWLYLNAVLVLAISDALAALVGSQYGILRFQVEEESKSLEGSLVFLVVTFLSVHLPMLLMTDLSKATCVLAALLISMLVTAFEIICLAGMDNLVIPLAVCLLLERITTRPVGEIEHLCVSFVATVVAIGLVVWRARVFNVGGAVVFILFAYGAWTLGSIEWAVPVFLAFAAYVTSRFFVPVPADHAVLRVRLLLRVVFVPLGILVVAHASARFGFFYGPYLAACAAILAFVLWNDLLKSRGIAGTRRPLSALAVGVFSWAVIVAGPSSLHAGAGHGAILAVATASVPMALLHDLLEGRHPSFATDGLWTPWRLALSFAAAAVAALLQVAGLSSAWNLQ